MISFLLKILLLSIVIAYVLKLFSSGAHNTGASGEKKARRFNPEGRVIRDATFTEIKEEGAGKDGPADSEADRLNSGERP
jgi:hypothetical protein